ncbi:hypothetical protein [Bacillus timonensis]|uniref:hypothetical protein n=1 Tax=Bacillus timonensis TaxID=1033734 RepID=UPI0012B523A1|nr:hypothetical protein [Bacillus timonensis]
MNKGHWFKREKRIETTEVSNGKSIKVLGGKAEVEKFKREKESEKRRKNLGTTQL